jgi:phosphate transport system substrate-binding protein
MRAFLGEYAREATWGRGGYLVRRGLVPSADAVRAENAAIVAALTPMDRASL